jgi:GntR family transcriptional repressor for pyruvate dehydrogenase complex
MEFVPPKKTRLYHEIVTQIQNLIKQGLLKPGDKLPSERELTEKLKVSRTTVREALRVLEILGYIDIKAGEGAFIKEITIENILEPLKAAFSVEKKLILDLIDVREVIEVETARRAAVHASESDLKDIENTILEGIKDIEEGGIGLSGDDSFHLSIARASKNQVFELIMILIGDLLTKCKEATLKIPGQPLKTIDDHKKIYQAIKERNPKKSASLMKKHLAKAKKNILSHLVCDKENIENGAIDEYSGDF